MLKKTTALFIVLLCCFTLRVHAVQEDFAQQELERYMDPSLIDELYEDVPPTARELLRELRQDGLSLSSLLSLSPKQFFTVILELVKERIRRPLVTLFSIIGVAVLCALINGMQASIWSETLAPVFGSVSVLCVITALAAPIIGCIRDTADAARGLSDFMLSFIPVFSGIITASGQPVSATTYQMFLFTAGQLMSQITVNTLVPLMCAYLALCLVGPIVPSIKLSAVASTVKSVMSWTLGLMTTIFVSLFTMQSMVSTSADTVATKATKFIIGSVVPVVGSALSDAFLAAQGCLRLLKTVVGAFGILVAALTFLPVLLNVVLWYLATRVGAAAGEVLGANDIASVLKSASHTLAILIAVLACFALMMIVTTTIIMLMGTGG